MEKNEAGKDEVRALTRIGLKDRRNAVKMREG